MVILVTYCAIPPGPRRSMAEHIPQRDGQALDLSPPGVQRVIDKRPFAEAHIV